MADIVTLDRLISLIEQRPMLWDKTSEDYKSRHLRASAWQEICVILYENFESLNLREQNKKRKLLITKWSSEREKWLKWRKRLKDQKSGLDSALKKPPYGDQLHFLEKIFKHNSSHLQDTMETHLEKDGVMTSCLVTSGSTSRVMSPKYVPPTKKKKAANQFELVMANSIDKTELRQSESPLLSFFRGIIPALEEFNTDEHLQFQIQVLNLIQSMKREKYSRNNPFYNEAPSSSNIKRSALDDE